MNVLKLFLLILALFQFVLPDVLPTQGYYYRFTSAKCSGSSKNTTSTHFCFVKNFNRNLSTMNFGFTLNRDLNQMFLKYTFDFKYGAVFRTIMDPPELEWCSFMGVRSKNVLMDVIIETVQDSVPGLIHTCPYKVVYSIQITKHLFKIFNIILE